MEAFLHQFFSGIATGGIYASVALALKLANQAYLLETGRVVISGSAEEIRNNEAVRRSYLGY